MNMERPKRIFKLGLTNFWRNRWLSLAATLVMTLTLLVVSIFVMMTIVINQTTASIREKMDISVYFNDSVPTEQVIDLQQQMAGRSDVKEVKYVSKEEALEIFKTQQEGKKVANLIDPNANPLPRSLEIKANKAEDLDAIAGYLNQDQFKSMFQNISYQENKNVIQKLIGFTNFIKKIGWISSIIFVLVAIMVILNTIRLTILTRKDEIEIMRLVGASDSFIKMPFVLEGIFYGFLATIFSTILLRIGMLILSPMMDKYLGISFSAKMTGLFSGNFLAIIGLELVVGIVIGVGCSLISMRKYLKV